MARPFAPLAFGPISAGCGWNYCEALHEAIDRFDPCRLLGVQRAELPSLEPAADSRDSALDALLVQLADQEPAAALLNAAGTIGIYAGAGVGASLLPRADHTAPALPGARAGFARPAQSST